MWFGPLSRSFFAVESCLGKSLFNASPWVAAGNSSPFSLLDTNAAAEPLSDGLTILQGRLFLLDERSFLCSLLSATHASPTPSNV
jgi:hypothetical protein